MFNNYINSFCNLLSLKEVRFYNQNLIVRENNFYEILSVKPYASIDEINKSYQIINSTDSNVLKAFECLKNSECRSEYTRFGSCIKLNDS